MFSSTRRTCCSLLGSQKLRRLRSFAAASFQKQNTLPPEVQIVEVGPRDGLQNESTIVSVSDKAQLIRLLAAAGCSYIEAGSFVSPKWVPQMANSAQVWESFANNSFPQATTLAALVPNVRGLEQAISCRVDEIAIFAAASETFSQTNINCSIAESLQRFQPVVQMAKQHSIPVRGYVSCVIACPYEGPIKASQVAKVTQDLLELGCYQVSLGDTIGVGTPGSTHALLQEMTAFRPNQLAVHFHDTYGQGLVNIRTSLEYGITTVDSSVAGLGGCPYAKGASGNVATEDVIYMLDGMGVKTGIDLTQLVQAAEFICERLGQPSKSRAGTAIAAKANPL